MLLLLACLSPKEVPPSAPLAPPPPPENPSELLAWILAGDPLVRHPRRPLLPPADLATFFQSVVPAWDLEQAAAGTVAVPFFRGARLAELELLSVGNLTVADFRLLAPFSEPTTPPPMPARPLLTWLGGSEMERLLHVVERQVILGWLDGPDIDLSLVAPLLQDTRFDRLADMPAGQLLTARAVSRHDEAEGKRGQELMVEATRLALLEVAADTAQEQVEWRNTRTAAATTYQSSGDPINTILLQAQTALWANAQQKESVGLALVAQAALRWREACTDTPCGGMDRALALRAARRWGVDTMVSAWEAIFWKDTYDHLDVAWGRPSAIAAEDDLVELLVGVPLLEPRILLFPEPGPASILALMRAMNQSDATEVNTLLRAVQAEVARHAQDLGEPRWAEPLGRILQRALDK